jgi:hypothetical protein
MKPLIAVVFLTSIVSLGYSQSGFYDVTQGTGNGLRFWSPATTYKISMGNSTEYQYSFVTGYSIKTSMSSNGGYGWTWGVDGSAPIAALSNTGQMQIAGPFVSQGLRVTGKYNSTVTGVGSALEMEVASGQYNSIRGVIGSSILGSIHFFDTAWGSGLPANGAGSINFDPATAVTIGPWSNIGTYFRKSDGFVGMGTTSPDTRLTVKGIVHAQEVKIDLNGATAPDYVFENDYKLPSLEKIKLYIDQYHHLPEVPSAKEMEEDGVKVGEMNMLLLKKVEELTLYVIELKKEIDELKANN